jgi:hypothetical protein
MKHSTTHNNDYAAELKSSWEVATLNKKTMAHVAGDKNKTKYAYIILAIAAVLAVIGSQLFPGWFAPSLGMSVSGAIFQFIMAVIGIYVLSVIAKSIFSGKSDHDSFFRVLAYGMIVTWVGIIPALSLIGAIWAIVIAFVSLKAIHKLTTGGVIGTFLITLIVMAIISMALGSVMAALGLGGMYQMRGFEGFNMNIDGREMHMDMDRDGDGFNMDIRTEDGDGYMRMEDGKMEITLPDGETMKIDVNE